MRTKLQDTAGSRPFAGRRALVIGGSGGIGRAVARGLAERGASLIIHGSSEARLAAALEEIRTIQSSSGFEAEALGLCQSIDMASDILYRLSELGRIDIAVCAFGPFVQKPLARTSLEDWERVALLDLALPGALASALLPGMLQRGWGRFLFFGGTRTDAIRAYRSNAAYAAAKTGLGVLVKSLALEGAPRGVASLLVCPGFVDTEYLNESFRDQLRRSAPGGRLMNPGELAAPALDLLSAEPCAASGAIISLDCGLDLKGG